MLVGADARRKDLRDVGVGDGRESEVDGPGGGGVPLVGHLAEGQHEREDPRLVIEEVAAEVARLDAAETQRRTRRKPQRVNRGRNVRPEGHQARVPPHLDAALRQLL